MKMIKHYILVFILIFLVGCDKDFVEVNTNPYAVTSVDPAILFANGQRSHLGSWESEHTIVQHFVNAYQQGATTGHNFNADVDAFNNAKWDQSYPNVIRDLKQAMTLLGSETARVNLLSMIRIWKAQVFMGLVDNYGDVPYFQAGRAVSDGIFFPVYDDDELIYEDLYKEITEALDAFDPGADYVPEDLFYGANSESPAGAAPAQVTQWRKLGNSLLLRLGMRYSEIDPGKAEDIVSEAFAGGVMNSNADNAYVKYDGTSFLYGDNNNLRNFSYFYYATEPLVDRLKSTSDPRGKFILANFTNPAAVANELDPDTDLANQFGVPIGIVSGDLADPDGPYRGAREGGLNYSQINVNIVASPAAPAFYVTYAQTSLLLAEAAKHGWIPGGDAQAETYYEDAIEADMQVYSLYPGTTPISGADITAYLSHPDVAYDATTALELINTQYWIVNLRNGTEAFANFRRTDSPAFLDPNPWVGNVDLEGGFVRRLSYPDYEFSSNEENYTAASVAIGGDDLLSPVFWDN